MEEIRLRPPVDEDWPAILCIAHESLSELSEVPDQTRWLNNRRAFPPDGVQHHFVAVVADRVAGYACAEHRPRAVPGEFRLFVVVKPKDRQSLGEHLLKQLETQLPSLGATHTWVLEYKADASFLAWWESHGFEYLKEFLIEDGVPAVELTRKVREVGALTPNPT
ncbi:MAG: GNAT family N-acetyltransferase [Alphaproteobacteria bacterium]